MLHGGLSSQRRIAILGGGSTDRQHGAWYNGGSCLRVRGGRQDGPVACPLIGTADPHGIGGVDGANVSRRVPTFSLLAYDAPSADELKQRELPVMNEVPAMAPLPPVVDTVGEPPVVTERGQVVTPWAESQTRRWLRMLKRCVRAARAGRHDVEVSA